MLFLHIFETYIVKTNSKPFTPELNTSLKASLRRTGFYTAAGGNPNYFNYEDLKNAMEVGVDRKPPEKVVSDVIAHFRVK